MPKLKSRKENISKPLWVLQLLTAEYYLNVLLSSFVGLANSFDFDLFIAARVLMVTSSFAQDHTIHQSLMNT